MCLKILFSKNRKERVNQVNNILKKGMYDREVQHKRDVQKKAKKIYPFYKNDANSSFL